MSRTQELVQESPGYGAAKTIETVLVGVLWLVKVLLMGAGEALVALYKQLKLLALTLTPGQEYELESDRAGRAAELRVAALWVRLSPSPALLLLLQNFLNLCPSCCEFGFL